MGVGSHLPAEPVRLRDYRLHFFWTVLFEEGTIALGKSSAGRSELDDVGAVLDVFANFGHHCGHAVSDTFRAVVKFEGQQIVVAVAAGDAEDRTGKLHARTD